MADNRTTLFADGILDASVTFGVARLTLAQTGSDGKPAACGQLVVPMMQLPALANSLLGLVKQVETKMKEQQMAGPAAEAAPSSTVPGSFRFG